MKLVGILDEGVSGTIDLADFVIARGDGAVIVSHTPLPRLQSHSKFIVLKLIVAVTLYR
jgi:hypothetical protein